LRRLEEKGYLAHSVENRTFVYRPAETRQRVAGRAVRRIVDWFCEGSVEALLVGMVDSKALDPGWIAAPRGADRSGAEERRTSRERSRPRQGDETMISSLVEAAIRSIGVALIVGIGLRVFRVRNVLAQKAAWSLVLAAALVMPIAQSLPKNWRGPVSMTIHMPAAVWRQGRRFRLLRKRRRCNHELLFSNFRSNLRSLVGIAFRRRWFFSRT
jgi:hypothetical protein